MKGMGTNITEKDSQWILKIHFLCTLTVGMHSVSLQASGGGQGWVPYKARSMDHRYGGDIQGESIAISA